MIVKKILFPTDFSECSQIALDMAASLARDTGAELLIVHVEEPPVVAGGDGAAYAMAATSTEELLARLKQEVPKDRSILHSHQMLKGAPAHAIAAFAEQQGVDMIVMGTHGRTGLLRLLMGSVAEGVVRHAPCAVLTVKPSARSAPTESQSEEMAGAATPVS